MKLLKNKKVTFVALLAILAVLSTQSVSAMHIMEGYLPLFWCIFWFAVFLPFFVVGLMRIKKIVAEDPNSKTMLALSGAFIFILSSLKIPSVTGSSSHPTGVGLGTAMFGPSVISVLGTICLLFQALLLAHGGLTTLGAMHSRWQWLVHLLVISSTSLLNPSSFLHRFLFLSVL